MRRDQQSAQQEQTTKHSGDSRRQLMIAPHEDRRQHDERRADGRAELAAFRRGQSSWN
jgi:hypothetical protein